MTAGNYKVLHARDATAALLPSELTCQRARMPNHEDEQANGFVTRKSHPHFYRSACNFRECLTSRGNHHKSPIK